MAAGAAWILNLDAEYEVATGRGYTPRRAVLAAMAAHRARIAATLLAPGDLLIDAETAPGAARGRVGRCYCPTPRALAALRRAGAEPEPHPPPKVLRVVLSRAFSASLGPTLPGEVFVTDAGVAEATLAAPPPIGDGWRVKRAYGMAGRDQRVVRAGAASAADVGFVRASIAEGGVAVEPNVRIVREYALHGRLGAGGEVTLGSLVESETDGHGAWLGAVRLERPAPALAAAVAAEAERAAAALSHLGYFGPFGVDAFTYEADGGEELRPRSEVNARFTMAFGVGFGAAPS
ncbi:MAG: hypothetical protein JNL38_37985 [Myxococcales bacterium]|nr:hypothetical protein [Myxococcales bacterium]